MNFLVCALPDVYESFADIFLYFCAVTRQYNLKRVMCAFCQTSYGLQHAHIETGIRDQNDNLYTLEWDQSIIIRCKANVFFFHIWYHLKERRHMGKAVKWSICPFILIHCLTHWGRVTHIPGVIKLTVIGSDNGLAPGRCQAIIWTSAGILLIGLLGTNVNWILISMRKRKPNTMQ